jgi:hypothetical protein
MYNNIWYEGLNSFCLELISRLGSSYKDNYKHQESKIVDFNFYEIFLPRRKSLVFLENENNDFLNLSVSPKEDIIVIKFRMVDKEENIFSGKFSFKEKGIISDYYNDHNIPFHEFMSNFFDFETLSLYQILSIIML